MVKNRYRLSIGLRKDPERFLVIEEYLSFGTIKYYVVSVGKNLHKKLTRSKVDSLIKDRNFYSPRFFENYLEIRKQPGTIYEV